MAAPRPLEQALLDSTETALRAALSGAPKACRRELRYRILEAVSADLGGFSLDVFRALWRDDASCPSDASIHHSARLVAAALREAPIPSALGLSSLARPEMEVGVRRSQGAYYTDFRLARYLVSGLYLERRGQFRLVDLACGTGILLAAAVLELSQGNTATRDRLLAESVCGADLSEDALRGSLLTLASLTADRQVVGLLRERLRRTDSLQSASKTWADIAPAGFDAVIGNPPWEKLKVTRHEWLKAQGVSRHYGEGYSGAQLNSELRADRKEMESYIRSLEQTYHLQGTGEHDLYKLFLELSLRVARPGGQIALLVPAGLIRSQGTSALRASVLDACSDLEFTVLENRTRFFAIDTRFKFLSLQGTVANGHPKKPIRLACPVATDDGIVRQGTVSIGRQVLRRVRPDLSIPEVRSEKEWKVFSDFVKKGVPFGDVNGPWSPQIVREVDMTQDSAHFLRHAGEDALPLIEGRMVHQYRYAAKRYVQGTGRRALWEPVERDLRRLRPQFWFPISALPKAAKDRVYLPRLGFCDITGQTNERTMLASRIPSGVVCGNKVPTVVFQGSVDQKAYGDCWLALVNSIPFDWMLRRVVTTTVNFFLLLDLSLPLCTPTSGEGARLAELSRQLSDDQNLSPWDRAELRAEIDWRVLSLYAHDATTMQTLLEDFPLLDRAQPALPREKRSTITRDFLLLRTCEHLGGNSLLFVDQLRERVELARAGGAVPYIPSHLAE